MATGGSQQDRFTAIKTHVKKILNDLYYNLNNQKTILHFLRPFCYRSFTSIPEGSIAFYYSCNLAADTNIYTENVREKVIFTFIRRANENSSVSWFARPKTVR